MIITWLSEFEGDLQYILDPGQPKIEYIYE